MIKVITATVTFLVLDIIWIKLFAIPLYQNNVGSILKASQNLADGSLISAILVYLLLITGVLAFPIALSNNQAHSALVYGFLFGLVTYGTFSFTNQAVINDWPFFVAIIDTLWGGFVCAATSFITVSIYNYLN